MATDKNATSVNILPCMGTSFHRDDLSVIAVLTIPLAHLFRCARFERRLFLERPGRVISFDAFGEGEGGLVAEGLRRFCEIGLRAVLAERIGVVEIFRLEIGLE